MGSVRERHSACQSASTVRALLQAAKLKGYQVVEGRYLGESVVDGPMYVLEGVQQLSAWFDINGNPCFKITRVK